jgi:protein TonB
VARETEPPPAPEKRESLATVVPPPPPVAAEEEDPVMPRRKPAPPAVPVAAPAAALRPPAAVAKRHDLPGQGVTEPGDRYLNALVAELERHRSYPAIAAPLGLSGTAEYEVILDRSGRILQFRILRSSGSELLDRTGAGMVRAATFPPIPPEIPQAPIRIVISLPIHPV